MIAAILCGGVVLVVLLAIFLVYRLNRYRACHAATELNGEYKNMCSQGQSGAGEKQPQARRPRYKAGDVLTRNMQDPSVAFRFAGEVGTLEGEESVGRRVTVRSIHTTDKDEMKYRIEDAKASCKLAVMEKHFDRRGAEATPFVVGDVVVRNNIDGKLEFNMKGAVGVVRPGTVATLASVFIDCDGEAKYTLRGAINWLPASKFVKYFSRVDTPPPSRRGSLADLRGTMTSSIHDEPLLETRIDVAE